jgi:hypothetical protein
MIHYFRGEEQVEILNREQGGSFEGTDTNKKNSARYDYQTARRDLL